MAEVVVVEHATILIGGIAVERAATDRQRAIAVVVDHARVAVRPVERECARRDRQHAILIEDRSANAVVGVAGANVGPRLVAEELRADAGHVQQRQRAVVLNRTAVVAGRVRREQSFVERDVAAGGVEHRTAVLQRRVQSELVAIEHQCAAVVVQRAAVAGRVGLQQAVIESQLGRGLVVDRSAIAVAVRSDAVDRRVRLVR